MLLFSLYMRTVLWDIGRGFSGGRAADIRRPRIFRSIMDLRFYHGKTGKKSFLVLFLNLNFESLKKYYIF